MCGIIAIYNPYDDTKVHSQFCADAKNALKSIHHRGPDNTGIYDDETVFLGHNRLSIMDPSALGNQPMQDKTGQVSLIFNGQIYNWKEIRRDLQKEGYNFVSSSDTESILALYLKYGSDFAEKMVGMWSIIIWDKRTSTFVVSRDRLGIKPLYICEINGVFAFASEIKAILQFSHLKTSFNEWTMKRYISRGWLDDVSETLYDGIFSFPVATTAVYSYDTEQVISQYSKFWRYPKPQNSIKDVRIWHDLFVKAVEDHMQSDVSLATTLSGGLDSNAINSTIVKSLGRKKDIHAFSLLAEDVPDESILINESVKELDIYHEYINLSHADYQSAIDEMLMFHDEPTYSPGQINQFVFRKKIKEKGYKVLLVGDGVDEILSGYAKILPLYIQSLFDSGLNKKAHQCIDNSEEFLNMPKDKLLHRLKILNENGVGCRTVQEFKFGYEIFNQHNRPRDDYMQFSKTHENLSVLFNGKKLFQELMDRMIIDIPQVLRNEDRNGMAHSIEVRPVFLDHRLLELSWKYSFNLFMQNGTNKTIMRSALKNIIPKKILDNKKKFVRPGSSTYLAYKALKKPIEKIISSKDLFFKELWVDDLLNLYNASVKADDVNQALVWLRFYMLQRTCFLKLHQSNFEQ